MKTFKSLTDFSLFAAVALPVITLAEMKAGLERCAALVETTAKDEIGTYQGSVGPFNAWAQLAQSTQDERSRQGYSPNEPLLRTGDLRDSIEHETEQFQAVIGSKEDVAAYQELGTKNIPPRPFLGPAVIRNSDQIAKILGAAVARGIAGGKMVAPSLGYDRDIT
ncbi:hypothetical protein [Burkholderia glumae]